MQLPTRRSLLRAILCGAVGFIALSILYLTLQNLEVYLSGTTKRRYDSLKTFLYLSTSNQDNATNSPDTPEEKEKLWYFEGGTIFPEKHQGPLQPFLDESGGDRFLNQLMYVPEDYEEVTAKQKLILLYQGFGSMYLPLNAMPFHGCPVNKCLLTDNKTQVDIADAIIFKGERVRAPERKRSAESQIWIFFQREPSAGLIPIEISLQNTVNWTSTYRKDSTVVAPYGQWMYYDEKVTTKNQTINYAAHKRKQAAWFVTNCNSNNKRRQYVDELSKYISVDIYGTCGTLRCPRSDEDKCFDMLRREYKFYLAFENSNCRDYITEKLFLNALGHATLPIAMGAPREDYKRIAPGHSYIHVEDFDSPKHLAAYLHKLDKDDDLYNSYFQWKGTGELIDTFYWCRLCAMLHGPLSTHYYENLDEWWHRPGTCTPVSWKTNVGAHIPHFSSENSAALLGLQ